MVSFPTWIVLLGLVSATGVLKAMRYVYPIPGDLLWWASALHVACLVLLAVKVLDHRRYVVAPSRWSMLTAMVRGWMAARDVERRHPGWLAQIEGRQPAVVSEATQPAASPAPAASAPGGRQ
jgi:hypothetical protein